MKDIARDLGVSLMTVSKALRNHGDISAETKRRVLKRARELNYRPNLIARSLVARRSYMIGLIIPDLMQSGFAEVAKGIARIFNPLGYQIVISSSEQNPNAELREIELLLDRSVDGLIIASAQVHAREELIKKLRDGQIPHVLIDRMPTGFEGHFVGVKDEEIGIMATEHLIEQGYHRIAHLRVPANSPGIGQLRGYRWALAKHDLEAPADYVVSGHHEDSVGYEGMRKLLQLNPRPDGVFCFNDPVGAGAIKAILEAGLKVPEDIAVIGAGNVHYSDLLRVPLSTIDLSSSLIAGTAANLLKECIESKNPISPRRILVTPRLIVRESSKRSAVVEPT
jgi:LacI family transcriptional regulator